MDHWDVTYPMLAQVFGVDWSAFLSVMGRLLLAVILGSFVGLERAMRDKPAGFRTNILICLGSCIFTIASQILSGPVIDQTRIAAQIVTGVGFLGAGAILRDAKGVVGLTTAATIWVVAAVGMACGFGQITLALGGTACIMMVLIGLPAVSMVLDERRDLQEYRLSTLRSAERIDEMERMFDKANLKIVLQDCFEEDGKLVFHIKALGPRSEHEALRKSILLRDDWHLCESV